MTTVSHILNRVEGKRISPETRERVLQVAEELGYAPNTLARGLRLQRSQTIGFVSDEIATTPNAGRIILGAQEAAAADVRTVRKGRLRPRCVITRTFRAGNAAACGFPGEPDNDFTPDTVKFHASSIRPVAECERSP